MIKQFESFYTLSESGIQIGDKVVVKYKNSKYFMQTGVVSSIITSGPIKGDCGVMMDYDNIYVVFYYTNLMKVEEIIEMPTGEVLKIPEQNAIEMAVVGLIKYNPVMKYYYFDEDDRWQIDSFSL